MLTNWNKIIRIIRLIKGGVLKPFCYQKAMMPENQVKLIHVLMYKYSTLNVLFYRVEKQVTQT